MVTTVKYTIATPSPPLHTRDEQGQQPTDAQTAFDIDESKVFQACCCSFLGFYWPEPGGMGCFGCALEGDLLCLGIL